MKAGKLTVEAEPYMGTLLVRGLPGQYVRVEQDEVEALVAALRIVKNEKHEAPRPGHVPTDLQQPQHPDEGRD